MSIARSTPAQNPRGPARRISAIGAFMALLASSESLLIGNSMTCRHRDVGFPAATRTSRSDQHLQSLALRHEREGLPYLFQPHPMRDQTVGYQGARRQHLHCPADHLRRVVEGAEQGQLLVVRPPRVETDRGTGRAAAEEQHAAAASNRVYGLLPHLA